MAPEGHKATDGDALASRTWRHLVTTPTGRPAGPADNAGGFDMRTWLSVRVAVTLLLAGAIAAAPVAASTGAGVPAAAGGSLQVAAAPCSPGRAACPIRIVFARGWYSSQASATMTGIRSERWFVVHARAHQTMVVLVEGAGPTRGEVHFPNGRMDGQPGGRVFDGILPVSGDYRIRVTESLMGTAWRGRVTVVVLIY